MTNILVYTAEFGGYEQEILKPYRPEYSKGVEKSYWRFSDTHFPSYHHVWQQGISLLEMDHIRSPQYKSRFHKTDPYLHFHEGFFDYTIWVDANVELKVDPEVLIKLLGDDDIMVFRHRDRVDIDQEGEAVVRLKGQDQRVIRRQIEHYKESGYWHFVPLPETGITVRRVNKKVQEFNKMWWDQLNRFSVRDQMSFGFCAWKCGLKVGFFPGHVRSGKYNLLHRHRSKK